MAPRTLRVLPDAGRVEHALLQASLQRAFVDASGFWSFSQLVTAFAPAPTLTPLTARLIVSALAREPGDSPFGAWARDAGFAHQAVELFGQLESQLATAEQLERAAVDARSARAAWLARLWRRFQRRKHELRLFDAADQLTAATAAVRRTPPTFDSIELHGFHELNPARLAFIHALPRASLRLPRADNPAIDALVNEVHADAERRHETSVLDLVGDVSDAPFARLKLFVAADAGEHVEGLAAFSAATGREEAREIARRVRAQLDGGAAPEDVAIVFRELDSDAAALIEALAERQVPARARHSVPLARTAAGQLALGLPMLVEDAFPAEAVARYLTSRYLVKLWESGAEPGQCFARAGIRDDRLGAEGDRGAYAVRLAGLATRFAEGWPKGPVDEVRAVARQVERLMAAARPLRSDDTLEGHLRAWASSLEAIGLYEGLWRHEESSPRGERECARDQAAADVLDVLQRTLSEAARVSGLATARLSRRDFSRWLNDAAGELSILEKGPRAGAVNLLEAREVSGRTFRHVFIGGLVDGRFPGRAGRQGLLADDEKGALNLAARAPLFRLNVGESEARLPLRLAEDRLLFYLSLCSATETVTLSHARAESLGRSYSPSLFLHELARAVSGFEVKKVSRHTEISNDAELRIRTLLSGARPDWAAEPLALAAMEHERLQFFSDEDRPPGPHSGDVHAADLSFTEAFAFDATKPLSAARLGKWGNCSFAGFLSEIIGLEPVEGQGEDIDRRSMGTLVHRVLEMLLPVLRETPANLDDVVAAAVDEAASKHERQAAVGHPLLWKLTRERVVRDICELIKSGRARPFAGVLPDKAEWKFSVPLPGDAPVTLGGKMDRVDVSGRSAVVIDYKTSRIEGNVERVTRLLTREWQLPVYAYALKAAGLADRVDGAWVSTRQGVKSLAEIAKDVRVTVDELISTDPAVQQRLAREGKPNLGNSVQQLVASMRAGDFGPRPEDCEHCRFRAVCRISTRKLHEEQGR